MPRSTGILALLLASSLVWAYILAHPSKEQPSAAEHAIEIWRVEPETIHRITVNTENGKAVVLPDFPPEGATPYVQVTLERTAKPAPRRKAGAVGETQKKEGAGDTAGAPKVGEPSPTVERFKGNTAVEKAMISLSALTGRRRIGELSGLDGESFGFPTDGHFLLVERKGELPPLRLELGARTFGNKFRYVLDPRDDTVYLVQGRLFDILTRGARRMMDNRILAHPPNTVKRVELRMDQNVVTLWRLAGEAPDPPQWARNPDEGEGDPALAEWVNLLARLRAKTYLEAGEQREQDAPTLEATLYTEEGEAEWVKLFDEGERKWRAVSSFTRHAVRVETRLAAGLAKKGKILTAEP